MQILCHTYDFDGYEKDNVLSNQEANRNILEDRG